MDVINETERRRLLPIRPRGLPTGIVCCLAVAFGIAVWHWVPRAPASTPSPPYWFHYDDGPFDPLSEEAAEFRAARQASRNTELKHPSDNACPQSGDAARHCAGERGTGE